jgi:hypothetical protein
MSVKRPIAHSWAVLFNWIIIINYELWWSEMSFAKGDNLSIFSFEIEIF